MFKTMLAVSGLLLGGAATAMAQSSDTPPTPVRGLGVTVYSATAAGLKWNRSSDDRGVRGYEVYQEGELVGEFDALSYIATGLAPGSLNNFTVIPVDSAGQRSNASTGIAFSTPGGQEPVARPMTPSLRAAVYSSTAAGLAWTRPTDTSTAASRVARYEVRRDGVLVFATRDASYIDTTLQAGRTYAYELVAINPLGFRSEPARVSVTTPGRSTGGGSGGDPVVAAPTGLRSVVYSMTAGAIAWDRASTPGLRYEVSRDGAVVGETDGTSYVDQSLAGGTSYRYTVVAIDRQGRRSTSSGVTLATAGGGDPVLGVDNAEAILKEIVTIANADFFPQFLPIVSEEFSEMFALWIPGSTASSDSYALVEGSAEDPSEATSDGLDGGRYTCLAGGSAALPTILGGEASDAYVVRFERCVTVSDTLGATVTFDGEASVFPGPRSSDGGFRSTGYTDLTVRGDALELAIDGSATSTVVSRGGTSIGDDETIVSRYARTTSDGESATVSAYRSRRSVNVSAGPGENPRTASAEIDFVATTPGTAGQTLDVEIDLAYDGTGTAAEGRIDQWDSGQIVVEAADGSRLRAEPIADDPTTLRIVVGDTVLERPWTEGYQIECAGFLPGCR